MRQTETLIIGAGISGLTYANFCKESYLFVERDMAPGGLCRTFYEEEDYVWDYAGHFFHFTTEEMKRFFEQRMDANDLVRCKKNTKIFYKESFIDYPFQMNIHQLPKEEFIDCLYDLFYKKEKVSYNNFEEMLYGKFGESITEKFLKPYNEKLYACNLNMLDTDAMGRFFPYANLEDIIWNMKHGGNESYNQYFDYPKQGAQAFVNILLEQIQSDTLLLQTEVKQIDLEAHQAVLSDGTYIQYERLINTTPFDSFLKMLQPERFRAYAAKLHANKVLVFNLGFDRKSVIQDVHWIYFPEEVYNFYRIGFYDNIQSTNKLSLYVEIGYETQSEIHMQEELSKTLKGLKKCGIISNHRLCAYKPLIIEPAYVHITAESKKSVEMLRKELEIHQVYLIGRYGNWTYCSIEDCMRQAIRLAGNIKL